jgi:hypothetical protein
LKEVVIGSINQCYIDRLSRESLGCGQSPKPPADNNNFRFCTAWPIYTLHLILQRCFSLHRSSGTAAYASHAYSVLQDAMKAKNTTRDAYATG